VVVGRGGGMHGGTLLQPPARRSRCVNTHQSYTKLGIVMQQKSSHASIVMQCSGSCNDSSYKQPATNSLIQTW
jgi:hypothetical protein